MKNFDFEKGSEGVDFLTKIFGVITSFIVLVFTGRVFFDYIKSNEKPKN